jgi:hypothetical protein
MHTAHPTPGAPRRLPRAVRRLARSPSVTVARLTLEGYARTGWILADLLLVVAIWAGLLFPYAQDTAAFYGTAGLSLGGEAILGTALFVRRSVGARTYLVLARLTSRGAYSRGLMLAAVALRVGTVLLLLALALASGRIIHPTLAPLLRGAVGLAANCAVVAVLVVTLSSPIATRRALIVFLLWLVGVLIPAGTTASWPAALPQAFALVRLPSLPILTLVNSAAGSGGRIWSPWPVKQAISSGWPSLRPPV